MSLDLSKLEKEGKKSKRRKRRGSSSSSSSSSSDDDEGKVDVVNLKVNKTYNFTGKIQTLFAFHIIDHFMIQLVLRVCWLLYQIG